MFARWSNTIPRRDWNSCRNFQALGTEDAELCSISQMRCNRATFRGTGVASTSRDAMMISATYIENISSEYMLNRIILPHGLLQRAQD